VGLWERVRRTLGDAGGKIGSAFGRGLAKTRHALVDPLEGLFRRRAAFDDHFFLELEEILIAADVGIKTSAWLVESLRADVRKKGLTTPEEVREALAARILEVFGDDESRFRLTFAPKGPTVILFVGVNGTGKTTTLGKLAYRLNGEGKRVLLAAGDTFRAGAIDQLRLWGERVGADVVARKEGADPAAVLYEAVDRAQREGYDVVLGDTAGRLHAKQHLMNELRKVVRVVGQKLPGAPHEVLLVLDGTTGQNGLRQAEVFLEAARVTGIAVTKLDGTARGGVVVTIQKELGIPVKLVGVGEGREDLLDFSPAAFVAGLFGEEEGHMPQ